MKALALILAAALIAGCTSRTELGECIGVADDKDPRYIYRVSGWNVFMGFLFAETIVVPVVVLATETSCPREVKP